MKKIFFIPIAFAAIQFLSGMALTNESGSNDIPENRYLSCILTENNNDEYDIRIKKISRGDEDKPYIALTFDGGSNARNAEHILDILSKKNVYSTFFLTGQFIENYPDIVRQIVNQGHEVGNHTFNHPHLVTFGTNNKRKTCISKSILQEELLLTEQFFFETTGTEMINFWRAPYGEINSEIVSWASELGYVHVFWTWEKGKSMDTLDWVSDKSCSLYRTPEEIKQCILEYDEGSKGGANGGIILMHLGSERSIDQPYTVLEDIIDQMRSKGYEFARISDLYLDICKL